MTHPTHATRNRHPHPLLAALLASAILTLTALFSTIAATSPHVAAAAPAAPLGEWLCSGSAPDGTPYSGKVTVTRQGDAFLVTWELAGDTFTGVGVLQAGRFAVAFIDHTRDLYGVSMFWQVGAQWEGEVTLSGSGTTQREVWRRAKP
jgi:hypothetical protein